MANRKQHFYPSDVDETLFGKAKPKRIQSAPSTRRPEAPTVTYITSSDMERIKRTTVTKTPEDEAAERKRLHLEKLEREKVQRDRNSRMKELEKKASEKAKKSDEEVADVARQEALRKLAAEKLDEETDMVKLFNSLASRASAFTIRDHQLAEKAQREKVEEDYHRKKDLEMEIDRLQDLKRRDEEAKRRQVKILEDRRLINEQMEYRHRMDLLAAEAKERDNMNIRQLSEKYKAEDVEKERIRRIAIEHSKVEIAKANADAIRIKHEKREGEKKEVQDILIYQAMQDAKLLKREEAERLEQHKKKEIQAKLLDEQEKLQNNAGKQDELRARRATEAHERRARQKEREEAMKKKHDQVELSKARAKQAEDKKAHMLMEKKRREQEYVDALEYAKKLSARENNEQKDNSNKSENHRVALRKQIADREFERKRTVNDDQDLGTQRRQALIKEENRLTVIRDKMIKDLETKGVNPKYLGELKHVDIRKTLLR